MVWIDPKQNTQIVFYDGASRPVQQNQHLRKHGQGGRPVEPNTIFLSYGGATIRTVRTDYDGNGRVTALTDDNGNATLYTYDMLDRETSMIFPDGSTRERAYNEAGDVVTYTDENGSVFENTFDSLGRKVEMTITPASGVIGTTSQTFEYDGLSRLTFARDSISTADADVNLFYDSLSRPLEDSQTFDGNTRNVTNTAFTSFPATEVTYPNDRQVSTSYDALYRKALVEETSGGADIAAWNYFGPSRVAELTLGNGLVCSFLNNDRTRSAIQPDQATPGWGDQSSDRLGYDGAGRMITKRWLAGGVDGTSHAYDDPTSVVGQTTAYDRVNNKLYERALHAESRSSLYEPFSTAGEARGGYDSIDRLRQYQRGVLSDGSGGGDPAPAGGSVVTPISLPNTNESAGYVLDGLGNWRRFVTDPVGGSPVTRVRQHNNLNAITRTDDGGGPILFSYDGAPGASNGNLANDGVRSYEWDALNRLKNVYKDPNGTPTQIGEYTYDALGRRIRKIVSNGGLSGTIPNGTTDFIYNTIWQCLEERDGSDDPFKQYVWGLYIDELVQLTTFTTINGNTAGAYYPLQDTLYRTLALTDDVGDLVETYDYDPYGNTLIFTAAGTGSDWWADDASQGEYPNCEQLFTGQRYDAEKATYQFRNRGYETGLGRFSSRDPILYNSGLNLNEYVNSRPTGHVDAFGLHPTGRAPTHEDCAQAYGACIYFCRCAGNLGQCRDVCTKKLNECDDERYDEDLYYVFMGICNRLRAGFTDAQIRLIGVAAGMPQMAVFNPFKSCLAEARAFVDSLKKARARIYRKGTPSFFTFLGPVCEVCEVDVHNCVSNSPMFPHFFEYKTIRKTYGEDHVWGEIRRIGGGEVITIDVWGGAWWGSREYWRRGEDSFGYDRDSNAVLKWNKACERPRYIGSGY